MHEVTVSFAGLSNEREAHELLAQELGFPRHYGHNLSAFNDCLTDVCTPTRLILDLSGVTVPELAAYLRKLAVVALRAAENTPALEVHVEGL